MLCKMKRSLRSVLSVFCSGYRFRPAYTSLGTRHVQIVLLFTGLLLAYAMRVNMSMAIVAMTDPNMNNTFAWSTQTQSVILSSFFWGYIMLQIPGGELSSRVGGKALMATAVGINSAVVMFIPWCAMNGSWKMVCACRVLQGLTQGVIFPSMHNLIGKWVPDEEKGRLGTFAYAGAHFGTALQLTTAGFIADFWGWPSIFYSAGALGAVWTVCYVYLGASTPQQSTTISAEEKEYIESSLGIVQRKVKLQTPWKSILTSGPFLALGAVHCGFNWGYWTLMAEIPSYMKKVLGADIISNGVLSALPYMAMYLLSFPCGFLADYALKKSWFSLTALRKISNSVGLYGAALGLIALCHASSTITTAVTLLTITVAVNVGYMTGFLLVHIDMAPNFAGSMMGITNGAANVISIIAPLAAGAILKDDTNPEEWKVVFYVAAAVYVVTNTIFVIFGTSERQPWNDSDEITDQENLLDSKSIKNHSKKI